MNVYEIECGSHKGRVEAATIGEAWRKLTDGKTRGFAELARWRVPRGVWLYVEPAALDKM